MADIAETQLYSVSGFSDGTDTYKGIDTMQFTLRIGQTLAFRDEGELVPSTHVLVGTDQPAVSVQFNFRSAAAMDTLLDATDADGRIASASVTAKDKTGATVEFTFTNLMFNQAAGNAPGREAKHQFSLQAVADTVVRS